LQIDYLDTVKGTGFAATGAPTLVYRGADGALLSSNTGSIKDTADLLARVGYRPDMPNYEQPLVLYLHVLRTPSAIRAPEAYLEFLSGIAKELAPLAPSHLGLTPLGSFHRQKREAELLTIPIKNLQGKTIILSNVDTTMFRTPVRAGTTRYAPAEDLDYWVNMRVYEEGVAGEGVERAVLVRLAGVLGLQGPAADAFALKGRRRFVIAMPDPLKNPTAEEVSRAINDLGVNMLPLDIFTQDPAATKGLMQEYTAMSFRPKPAALRSVA
jgi:hypothetical protein